MITLDTSALVAHLNDEDPNYDRVTSVLDRERGAYIVPVSILAEVAYFLERLHPDVLDALLADFDNGGFVLDCGEQDIPRIRQIVRKYADLPLGPRMPPSLPAPSGMMGAC